MKPDRHASICEGTNIDHFGTFEVEWRNEYGWYWVDKDGEIEGGPFATSEQARKAAGEW